MRETFIVSSEADIEHNINDENCGECWTGYPKKCKCGGLIHAEFGDENYDCDYWLFYRCDKCGMDFEEA